jgi:NAD-dependent SIR2 family protein deacetylase
MTTASDMLEKYAQIISNARRIVCFTGAGMSAESGIGTVLWVLLY